VEVYYKKMPRACTISLSTHPTIPSFSHLLSSIFYSVASRCTIRSFWLRSLEENKPY